MKGGCVIGVVYGVGSAESTWSVELSRILLFSHDVSSHPQPALATRTGRDWHSVYLTARYRVPSVHCVRMSLHHGSRSGPQHPVSWSSPTFRKSIVRACAM